MYSKYPTEVNKYECRTGPFEGFFVSSVEFCKVKFDKDDQNDKDIRQQHKAHQVYKAHKASQVRMVPMVLKVPMVSMEQTELMVQKLIHVLHVYLML